MLDSLDDSIIVLGVFICVLILYSAMLCYIKYLESRCKNDCTEEQAPPDIEANTTSHTVTFRVADLPPTYDEMAKVSKPITQEKVPPPPCYTNAIKIQ